MSKPEISQKEYNEMTKEFMKTVSAWDSDLLDEILDNMDISSEYFDALVEFEED